MKLKFKFKLLIIFAIILSIVSGYLYVKYYFTYEQKNVVKREFETITGLNLTVTVFDYNGKVVQRWVNIKKITAGKEGKDYTYFYTKDDRYVQIPGSVWYIAEEQKNE
jgi:Tfp pilus assembly major pilin PilA